MEKIKLDFTEPHIVYRLKNGEKVVGVTTAIGTLNKPALPLWGFNTGKAPMFESIDDAALKTNVRSKETLKVRSYLLGFLCRSGEKISKSLRWYG
jgi:hypothetical protein